MNMVALLIMVEIGKYLYQRMMMIIIKSNMEVILSHTVTNSKELQYGVV